MKGKYRKEETAIRDIEKCLKEYYNIPQCKRNKWRYEEALKEAKFQLRETGEVYMKGAQWGGKWGNYYRAIGLSNKGRYAYVEGFNPQKILSEL